MEITCSDISAFRKLPPGEFRKAQGMLKAAAERVAAGTMTKAAYNDIELMSGFRFNPHGILQCARLHAHISPLEVITYDWVHSALQGGTLTTEVEAMIAASGTLRDELQKFLADSRWEFPHRMAVKGRSLHRIFDLRRVASDEPDKVKATCSELLGVYGLLRFFFELKLGASVEHEKQLQSFNAACKVVDLLLHLKAGLAAAADAAAELENALQDHLALHRAAYGDNYIKPKHHWMLDVPSQLRRDGMVLDAFVVERTHLRVKALAEKVKNTVAFEQSVLSGLVTSLLQNDASLIGCGLLGRTQSLPGFQPPVVVADRLRVYAVEISVGDVALRGDAAGHVQACVMQSGELFLFVSPLQRVSRLTSHCDVCMRLPQLAVWPAADVTHALAWRLQAVGTMLVVHR